MRGGVEPIYFCGHADALGEGVGEAVAYVCGPAYAREEARLEKPGDAEGGGEESYAEGWCGANEEILRLSGG